MPILNWLDRDKHIKAAETVPYRLLEADDTHGAGDFETPNMLIQGDNLEALKALLPYYAGRVKCIFIDPPYNTRSAFEHFDDNLEHSQWLAMMFPRLLLLRDLLAEDGSIWVTIDDNEGHYLKAIMDEVFGRKNFVANCVWQSVIPEKIEKQLATCTTISCSMPTTRKDSKCREICFLLEKNNKNFTRIPTKILVVLGEAYRF